MARIRYTLSFPRPSNHLIDVALEVDEVRAAFVDLVMPAWIPGSYRIRDFARHVQEFEGPPFWKVDKNTWRVETSGRTSLRVRYRIYAFELSVRTSHVDADHAHVNPAGVCMYVEGRRDEPCEIRLAAPDGWRAATGLAKRGGGWWAESYDRLADSPIEVGRFESRIFRVGGKVHQFVVCGAGNYDLTGIVSDTAKIVKAGAKLFGGLPYERYVFILHATDGVGGGLEHWNSTSLMFPRMDFEPRENYRRCLNLIAHEFFHTWNVKRIRPEAFRSYDYTREMYTDLLWMMEGFTDYYALLLLGRAGLLTEGEVRDTLGRWFEAYYQKPGRRLQSLSESSFDAWIKLYQPNEHSVNSSISYYEKGKIVALLLDMEIRRRSRGRRSLDDVMRGLYREFGARGRGIERADVVRLAETAAGGSLAGFFRDFVDGTRELPLNRALRTVGLRAKEGLGKNRNGATLGIVAAKQSDRVVVTSVLQGTPADAAGLSARDEIVAVNGFKATAECWDRILETSRPGDKLSFSLFRDGRLRSAAARLGRAKRLPSQVERVARVTPRQSRAYRSWMGR